MSLKPILKADSVDAVRMSDGRLFHATGPATENACILRAKSGNQTWGSHQISPGEVMVRRMTRSPRAAEQRAPRVETDETGRHKSSM